MDTYSAIQQQAVHLQEWDAVSIVTILGSDAARDALRQLHFEEHQLASAESAAHALELVSQRDADLLIVDTDIAERDSTALCRRMKADRRACRVLLLAGADFGEDEKLQQALDCGADDVVVLPAEPTDLAMRVQLLTRLARLTRDEQRNADYRHLVERAPMALMAIDRVGTIGAVNPHAASILRRNSASLVGENVHSLIAAKSGSNWVQGLQYALATGLTYGPVVVWFVRDDGSEFAAEVRMAEMQHQGHSGLVLTLTDATDAVARAEEDRRDRVELTQQAVAVVMAAANARHSWSREIATRILTPLRAIAGSVDCDARGALDAIQQELEGMLHQIAPSSLVSEGLVTALGDRFAAPRQAGMGVVFESELGNRRYAPAVEEALYHAVDQVITHIVATDGATLSTYLWQERAVLCLELEADHDAGLGLNALDLSETFPEISVLGGNIAVDTTSTGTTALYIELPVGDED